MAVHIIDSSGRRNGLAGKKTHIYTVKTNGTLRVADYPVSMTVYRSTTLSVAAGAWAPVTFDNALFPYTTYGTPDMWSPTQTYPNWVYIRQNGWYLLSASIQFLAIGTYNTYQGFRIYTNIGGLSLLAGRMWVQNNYSFPQSGEIVYYLSAGEAVRLEVSHSHTAAMTLDGGLGNAMLSVTRLCS